MGVITAIEPQKDSRERVNLYIDGKYAFSLSVVDAARLKKGQTLSEAEQQALDAQSNAQKAIYLSMRYLQARPRSTQEIRDYLDGYGYDEAAQTAACEYLTQNGYLDDASFARSWVESRERAKPRSASALRRELQQKGIDGDIIKAVTTPLDPEDSAYRAALGQARRLKGYTQRDFTQKMTAYLARRGFGYGVAKNVCARLIAEMSEQDAAFFAAEPPRERTQGGNMSRGGLRRGKPLRPRMTAEEASDASASDDDSSDDDDM
jgi:regulatory protein